MGQACRGRGAAGIAAAARTSWRGGDGFLTLRQPPKCTSGSSRGRMSRPHGDLGRIAGCWRATRPPRCSTHPAVPSTRRRRSRSPGARIPASSCGTSGSRPTRSPRSTGCASPHPCERRTTSRGADRSSSGSSPSTPSPAATVQDERARTAVWLDLAYPGHLVGIEYEGAVHESGRCAARRRPVHGACRPGLADLPLHEVRGPAPPRPGRRADRSGTGRREIYVRYA
jgi:hypothetical protein